MSKQNKKRWIRWLTLYIFIWVIFGLGYWGIANNNQGQDYIFQEDILFKRKSISFQEEAKINIPEEITIKLITKFDQNSWAIPMTDGTHLVLRYNYSLKGLTSIGLDWANYYVSKFENEGYNFLALRMIKPEAVVAGHKLTKFLLEIVKIPKENYTRADPQELLILDDIEQEKIEKSKKYYIYVPFQGENCYNFRDEYYELKIMTNIISSSVNFLDNDISIIDKYERQNKFKYSLIDFLYFSAVTITTLGYGDILPNSSIIRCLVMFETLIGMILIAVFTASFYDWIKNKKE